MQPTTYHLLGRTGLRVSRLSLGTMTFGTENGWGCDRETARAMFDAYLASGGNFIDSADIYTQGTAETWLGGRWTGSQAGSTQKTCWTGCSPASASASSRCFT